MTGKWCAAQFSKAGACFTICYTSCFTVEAYLWRSINLSLSNPKAGKSESARTAMCCNYTVCSHPGQLSEAKQSRCLIQCTANFCTQSFRVNEPEMIGADIKFLHKIRKKLRCQLIHLATILFCRDQFPVSKFNGRVQIQNSTAQISGVADTPACTQVIQVIGEENKLGPVYQVLCNFGSLWRVDLRGCT